MDAFRRRLLLAGAGWMGTLPAWARAPAAAPLFLVLDIDTPGARQSFEGFKAVAEQRFAGASRPPVIRFAPVLDRETPANVAALGRLVHEAGPTVVFASNAGIARMCAQAKVAVPVLFFSTADPVAMGLTGSLTHPDRNMTGFTLGASAERKRREMLLRLFPACRVMGLLTSRNDIGEGIQVEPVAAPGKRAVVERRINCETLEDFRRLMASPEARAVDAWDVAYVHVPFRYPEETVERLSALRKPVMYPRMKHVRLGGMAAYEPRIEEADDAWASQAASILAGVPVSQIPVIQASRYSFGLNLKACRAVGIDPPKSLLRTAELVIE